MSESGQSIKRGVPPTAPWHHPPNPANPAPSTLIDRLANISCVLKDCETFLGDIVGALEGSSTNRPLVDGTPAGVSNWVLEIQNQAMRLSDQLVLLKEKIGS